MSGLNFEMSCCFEVMPEMRSKLEILGYYFLVQNPPFTNISSMIAVNLIHWLLKDIHRHVDTASDTCTLPQTALLNTAWRVALFCFWREKSGYIAKNHK